MPNLPAKYDARETERALDAHMWPYVSRTPYTVASKPNAASSAYRKIILSDGAANRLEAMSNGTAWYYLDGTAV